MRFCLLLAFACAAFAACPQGEGRCTEELTDKQISDVWVNFWDALKARNAEKALSLLAPDFKRIVNGVEDEKPWKSAEFLKGLFEIVHFDTMQLAGPVARVNADSVLLFYQASAMVSRTGDVISIGPLTHKLTVTDDLRIAKLQVIGDHSGWDRLYSAADPAPLDLPALFQKLLEAFEKGDAAGLAAQFAPEFTFMRNGNNDMLPWKSVEILKRMFSRTQRKYSIVNLAISSATTVIAQLKDTIKVVSSGEQFTYYDGWAVQFNAAGLVTSISSTVSLRALQQVDAAVRS